MPDLVVRPACNQNCIMCTNAPEIRTMVKDFNFEKIKEQIDACINKDYSKLDDKFVMGFPEILEDWTLSGGEPTLNPNYFKILDYLKEKIPNVKIRQLTHGRSFINDKFLDKFVEYDNIHVCIPLHGYNSSTHDYVVGAKGAFLQATKGILKYMNKKKYTQTLEIRLVISKLTNDYIGKIYKLIYNLVPNVDKVVTVFIEYDGYAIQNLDEVKIDYKTTLKKNEKAFEEYGNKFRNFQLYHFPLCVLKNHRLWKYTYRTLAEEEVTYVDKCKNCKLRNYCLGVPTGYVEQLGLSEIESIESFDLDKLQINNSIFERRFHPIVDVKN